MKKPVAVSLTTDKMGNLTVSGHGMEMLIIELDNKQDYYYRQYTIVLSIGMSIMVGSKWDFENQVRAEDPADAKLACYFYDLAMLHFDYIRPEPVVEEEDTTGDVMVVKQDESFDIVIHHEQTGLSRVE